MIIIIQGPPASGKTKLAQRISNKFNLPHISRDIIQEWLSVVDETKNEHIQSFCGHAGYALAFDLAGELSKGSGSFIVEGCFNPDGGPSQMKEKLSKNHHEIIEIFLTAPNHILVQRYLNRANSDSRHPAHGDETSRGKELEQHLKETTYRPMKISRKVIEIDNSNDFETTTNEILNELERMLQKQTRS